MPLNNFFSQIERSHGINPYTIPIPTDTVKPFLLIPRNPDRKGLIIWNETNVNLLIDFGIVPTLTSFAFKIASYSFSDAFINVPITTEFQGLLVLGTLKQPAIGTGIMIREFI